MSTKTLITKVTSAITSLPENEGEGDSHSDSEEKTDDENVAVGEEEESEPEKEPKKPVEICSNHYMLLAYLVKVSVYFPVY